MQIRQAKINKVFLGLESQTYGGDDSDGVEEATTKSPPECGLVLFAVPASLLHGYNQTLFEATQLRGYLRGPIFLMEHLHFPAEQKERERENEKQN